MVMDYHSFECGSNELVFFLNIYRFLRMLVIIGLKVVMLSLAWKLKAEQMGFFTVSEWVRGMTELQYETSDFDV